MPKVRLLQAVAGTGFAWAPGDEVDMTPADARVWADGLRGELVREPTERTVVRPAEKRDD